MNSLSENFTALIFSLGVGLLLIGCSSENQMSPLNESADGNSTDSIIISKAFPLIEIISESQPAREAFQKNNSLNEIAEEHYEKVINAVDDCQSVSCYASAIQWSEDEISDIGDQLIKLYQTDSSFEELIPQLKKSYKLYAENEDTTLLRNAWENAALGVNNVLDVYLKGHEPRYPAIDSISFKVDHASFINRVHNKVDGITETISEDPSFFELPLKTVLMALEINGRDEAARYEPLEEGYNRKPVERIRDISWGSYDYSMVLIPGQGPQERGVILDSLAMRKIDLALERYEKGVAPFLMVSGGHVHPYKTPYCEAVEMKKYMVKILGIPREVIFIEPHARHTTTNIRNVSRLIYRYDIPPSKPVLIVTDSGQNSYINGNMKDRALNELKYLPYDNLKMLSNHETEFYPIEKVLQPDPIDILDP